jgi:small subunit ribosomal protein S19e
MKSLPTVYDVPANELINRTADHLRANINEISPPSWMIFVKTGSHLQNPPQSPDFWYVRCASILRTIYLNKSIGIARIRKKYGGRTSKGTRKKHKRDGGGAIIRNCFKQLEEAGLIKTVDKKGRTITEKGISLLDSLANKVFQERKLTLSS